MRTLRAFIAVEIPPAIQQAILHETESLRRALGPDLVRWVPVENLHLTLKFLGDISSAHVDAICGMLTAEAARFRPLPVGVGGLGAFPALRHGSGPTSKRVRVLWVGLDAPAGLASLQHGIESAAAKLGYEAEERPFSPHLTIGRVRQQVTASDQQAIAKALERTSVGALGEIEVTAVHLFKSELNRNGAVYTRLFSAPLNPNAT